VGKPLKGLVVERKHDNLLYPFSRKIHRCGRSDILFMPQWMKLGEIALSTLNQKIRRIMNRFGCDIIRLNEIGHDPLTDFRLFFHNDQPLIFDVGANVGQTVSKLHTTFPRCKIHSFEPSPTTFATLKQEVSQLNNVYLHNCALGAASGQQTFLENNNSDMSSFLLLGKFGWGEIIQETVVEVNTVDTVCDQYDIQKIDLLKSDTQGFDFEVFKGAEQSICANKIGLIYFEVIFSDMYKGLPSFGTIYDYLIERNFSLVSFYKFYYQEQLASWTDVLFVHKSYLR
jgi:FkbM family methyltransferase